MPAEPYSLGIGVQIDQKQLSDVLGQLSTALSSFGTQLSNSMATSFTGLGAGADPISALVPGMTGSMVDQITGEGEGSGLDSMTKSMGNLSPIMDQLVTLTVETVSGFSKLNASAEQLVVALGGVGKATDKSEAKLKDLDKEVQKKPTDFEKFVVALQATWSALSFGATVVGDFSTKLRDGFNFTKEAEELERATIQMAVGMGGGWKEADKLRGSIYDLANASGESLVDITKLSMGLSKTGETLTDFSTDTQQAIIDLSTRFNVSGESIAKTTKTLGTFGMGLGSTLGDAVAFQKGFKLPGIFEALPGIVDFARDTILSFSEKVVGSGGDVVKSVMHTAGAFAKAFGTTIADGARRAEAAISKFAGAAQQDQDVFLGLSTEFSGLTMSLMQVGVPIQQAMKLTQGGVEDTVEAAKNFRDVIDRMPNAFMKDRFMRQLQKELPQDVYALVRDTQLLQKTITDRRVAAAFENTYAGKGVGAFNEMTGTIQSATVEVRALFNNMVTLGKAIFGSVGKMLGFDKILVGGVESFHNFNKSIRTFVESDKFKGWVDAIRPGLIKVGKVVLTLGTLIGGLVGGTAGVHGLGKFFRLTGKGFGPLIKLIPGLGKSFEFLGKVGKRVFGAAGGITEAVGIFEGIKTAIMDMGEVLGDPNATGWEKFEAVVGGSVKGIAKFIDTMLLGIPGMVLDKFFPDMERSFDAGLAGIFDKVHKWFDGSGGIGGIVGNWVKDLGGYMANHLPDFKDFAAKFGKNFGAVLANMGSAAVAILKAMIIPDFFGLFSSSAKEGTKGFVENFTVGDAVLSILSSVGQTLLSFLGGVAEGMANSFGTSLKGVEIGWKSLWIKVKGFAEGYADWFYDGFVGNIIKYTKLAGVGITGAFSVGFAMAKEGAIGFAALLQDKLGAAVAYVADQFKALVEPMAGIIPGMAGLADKLDSVKKKALEFHDSLAQAAADAHKQTEDVIKAGDARVKAIYNEQEAREAASKANVAYHEKERDAVITAALAEQTIFDQRAKAATETRRAAHAALLTDAGKKSSFAGFGGAGGGEDEGILGRISRMMAGDVANSAVGPANAGINQEAIAQMFSNFQASVVQAQRVQVTLKGDGAITRPLAREAAVQNLNANGGD